ncbi:MAG: NAD(P)H-dependent oxidoreductase [Myxococcota bacterium]
MKILHIDASAKPSESIGRPLTRRLAEGLSGSEGTIVHRSLGPDIPLLHEDLLAAVAVTPEARTPEQARLSALPDTLIEELENADAVVIGVPIYNFGVPGALKAWMDLVARARRTFKYTENGPVGLLKDRPVYLVITSGGTPVGSAADFAMPHIRHFLGFLGLHDVRLIDVGLLAKHGKAKIADAEQAIDDAIQTHRRLEKTSPSSVLSPV